MESENEGNTYNGDDGVTDSLTPSEEPGPHRTPFYDYANERFDSHADAKLIYQRHRLESETKATSPFMLAKSATLPVLIDHDNVGLSRTASMTSRASNRSHGPKHATAPSQSPQTKQEPFPSLDTRDPFLAADEKARSHSKYPGLPHENKDSLLAEQGFHGAGAGMGIGSGAGGFASNESSIVSEVEAICKKIKELLDMRQKFLEVSLQCPGDNPKDDESWEIYPPPPEPFWAQEKVSDYAPNLGTPEIDDHCRMIAHKTSRKHPCRHLANAGSPEKLSVKILTFRKLISQAWRDLILVSTMKAFSRFTKSPNRLQRLLSLQPPAEATTRSLARSCQLLASRICEIITFTWMLSMILPQMALLKASPTAAYSIWKVGTISTRC